MLYILLPVHNRKEITKQFIACLKEQTFNDYHLIVIDDGSTDGTAEMIKNEMPNATILKGNGKLWWAGSLQKGFEWLRKNANGEDIVLIINNDVTFKNDFLEIGISLIKKNPNYLIQAQAYSQQTHTLIDTGTHIDWKNFKFNRISKVDEINCLSTRGLIFYFNTWLNIGGFHPFLLPHYASDYEFTIRAFKKGYKLITYSNFFLFMDESISGYRSAGDKTFIEYLLNVFRIKDLRNPLMWSMFIFYSCPKKYLIQNFLRIWKAFFSGALRVWKNKIKS